MDRKINSLVEQLTDKQRECLRLVWRHQASKDIARTLGISPHSVDSRIKTAMRSLGVDDRFEAARLLVQLESGQTDQRLIYPPSDIPIAPIPDPSLLPWKPGERQAEHLAIEESQAPYRLGSDQEAGWFSPPLPVGGRRTNDLSPGTKLFWVATIAIGTALAFGVLASGLEALSRLA